MKMQGKNQRAMHEITKSKDETAPDVNAEIDNKMVRNKK